MEILLPGINRLPHSIRRALGVGLLALVVLAFVIPVIVLAGAGPACGGGYPKQLCDRPLDTVVDQWGMYNRECVSYTAWKVASTGRTMPADFGDANKWPAAARARGIRVDTTPQAGDVAILSEGKHGHSMYVESVNADGSLNISQYNKNKTGAYSQETISTAGLVFIHF